MSQIGGRLLLSLMRLVIALIVVRYSSAAVFGEYVVVLSVLLVAEWLVDFGMTEIAVLRISQREENRERLLRSITVLRIGMSFLGFFVLLLLLQLLDYDETIFGAVMIGAIGLLFHAGALVYRVVFRVNVTMVKDVGSELLGVVAMLPLVLVVSLTGADVEMLAACYLVSKIVYFLMAAFFGRRDHRLSVVNSNQREIGSVLRQSMPLGVAGVLVVIADTMVPLILSKVLTMEDVGLYSVAMRFVLFASLVTSAVSSTFYPLLSRYWRRQPEAFRNTQQSAVELVVLFAGLLSCGLFAGSHMLIGFFGADMAGKHEVLQWLSLVVFARALTGVMSPMLIIAERQTIVLAMTSFSLSCSFLVVLWLVNHAGILGAVSGYVAVDYLLTMVPVLLVSQRLANVWLDWWPVGKIVVAAVLAVMPHLLWELDDVLGIALTVAIYGLVCWLTGVVQKDKVHALIVAIRER